MTKVIPTYDMKNDSDLSKFLLGAIRDVRKNELDVEKADVISKLADKYTKNEIMRCVKAKLKGDINSIDIGAEMNKALLTAVGANDKDEE